MPTPSTSLDDAGRLEELRALQLLASPLEPEFDNIAQLASEICSAPVALISFVDRDRVWFKSRVGFDALQAPREHSFCSLVIEGVVPMIVEDATADLRFQKNEFVMAPHGIRFYAGFPLVLGSGFVVGSLCVIDHKVRSLSEKELSGLKRLATLVIALIEAKRTQLRLVMQDRNHLLREERLKFALEAAEIGDWDRDLHTNVTRRSLTHDRCFGYTKAVHEWGYDTFLAHIFEADRARVDDGYQRALAGRGSYDFEYRVVWPDQTVHWLWSKGRFYFDDQGEPNRVDGIVVEITERKKVDEALRESEYRWRFAIEGSGDGLWDWDIQNSHVFYSERWLAMLGLENDATGHDPRVWSSHLHPQDKDRVLAQVQAHLDAQTSHYANEHRVICEDGSTKWMLGRGLVVQRDNQGRPLRMIGTNSDITEQRQAADVLRVSELALQAISQGVIITGPDQLITSANASFTAMTGYSAAEILARSCKFLQGPDTDPETVAAIRAAMRRPAEFAGEILNYRKDGTVFWNELTIAPVLDVHGTLAHFIGIMRDVSTRRATELQLRHQESQLAQADMLAGLGRWDWNLTDDSARWSDELYRIYGRDPADGVPAFDDWQETIHSADQARLAHCIQTALAGASAYHVEFRIFTKDTGQLRYVESRGSSVVDANGKPTHIRGFDLDITERKLTELALKASNAQLQLLETCVSRLNDIVLITEAEPIGEPGPVIVFVNDAFERRTGFTREEVIGKSPRLLQGPKTDRKELDRIRAALERWEPVRAELLNYTKSGEEFWIELDIVPVADATGWYTHWVAVERDVTERKQNQMDLQTSLAEKTALLMEVHHRVKNNLQVVTSLLRLESRRSDVPETVGVLKAMQARIHTMAQLHESLYRSGTFASVDLGVYLGQIATQAFQAQVPDSKRVRLRLTMGWVPVGMDQAVAGGLLVNELVSNCLKHGFAGARSGEVHVELQPEDAAAAPAEALWRLRVSDTGAGLSADFEDKRKTSLGLILAEDLSQQLGGTLNIQSQPGIGAEFSVVFKALEPVPLAMPV